MTSPKSSPSSSPDSAQVRIPPPLIFVGAALIGYVVHRIAPVAVRPPTWSGFGLIVTVFGLALITWAAVLFRRAQTEIPPWRPTTAIVTSGPYSQTRNPIYLGFALIQLGYGLWSNRLAVVLMVIPAVAATNAWVIAREESYLQGKFGDVYLEYTRRVRRWI